MAEHSTIEWTDATWNPVVGCSLASPGCTNCYAMKLAGTRLRHLPSREGLTQPSKAGPVWNGQVRLVEEWLTQPLRWKKPRRIFVNSMSDLFHEDVADATIDRVFAVMALCPQHTFQILTKHAKRMREYLRDLSMRNRVATVTAGMIAGFDDATCMELGVRWNTLKPWPLPNVWLGVSTEDQERADERIPDLLATPAARRFVSLEPLLGPICFRWSSWDDWKSPIKGVDRKGTTDELDGLRMLDWVIAGGESGPGARPMHPDWVRSLRDQCATAKVPFFFKQWGEWRPDPSPYVEIVSTSEIGTYWPDGTTGPGDEKAKGGTGHSFRRVGKKAAGAEIDSKLHREFPREAP